MKLLTKSNAKIIKGEARGWLTMGLHLAPGSLSGYNMCPWASRGCLASCLNTSGMGAFNSVQASRVAKTRWYKEDFSSFARQLITEIAAAEKSAAKKGMKLAIRLNLTSDIAWESVKIDGEKTIMEIFPTVTFYDYTKSIKRALKYGEGKFPHNYSLTFSRSEENWNDVEKALNAGVNVAAVFRGQLPEWWEGRPVIDGDQDDLRFLDKPASIVGLLQKGRAKKDDSGFVLHS